ncbi:MAG TPA: bifunctional phosphoribosyl-AMP cyclohydrolase/phosphoribosyl-ATP diphosphatase HisIE [Sphingomicrobium sp.]|nr:bifunctional phosphoribosyl-AMP cyclohydrolase/phosphoribosyl-ATP diphosphatase HisIE [Sphingomicrobium sp.]
MRDRNAPLSTGDIAGLAWEKMDGLLPAIVQDPTSGLVLMVGYMDEDALEATLRDKLATFFSRSKGRRWQKGETSGHHLRVQSVFADCDNDALLVEALPAGPTCHTGTQSCFGDREFEGPGWLAELSAVIRERAGSNDQKSYTRRLLDEGPGRIAQKDGEEGVEVALAAVSRPPRECAEELADLFYHVAVLMEALVLGWDDVTRVLKLRHASQSSATASS